VRLKNIDLVVILTIVALNIVYVLLPIHVTVIGVVLALPLVFLLPGYVVTEILSYKRALNTTYSAIFSVGLSLAIDILGGFILNVFTMGLRAVSWVVLLGLLTVAFSLLTAFLRRGSHINERRMPVLHLRIHEYIVVGFAILVVVLSLHYSVTGVVQQPHMGFTQLWLLPAQSEKSCTLRLGVRSFESTSTMYVVVMKENDKEVGVRSSIVLAPQEEWDSAVPLAATTTDGISIKVSLYKAGKPENVYREVHIMMQNMRKGEGRDKGCGTADMLSANNLRTLLLDPKKRERMGNVGRQRAKRFTVGTVTNRIEEIYKELLNRSDRA